MDRPIILDRCVEALISGLYQDLQVESSALVETPSVTASASGDDTINVYVKSFKEVSIDEVPIIVAIMNVLRGSKLRIYEYERITHSEKAREEVLARLVRLRAEKREPSIIVMPKALPTGLYGLLPEEALRALSEGAIVRVRVFHDNILYLPRNPPRSGVEIVAKRNSESSYARVVWLQRRAATLGVPVRRTVFLEDNPHIFRYALSQGVKGLLERVPVNKLAHYALALDRCGVIGPVHELRREEKSEHYIYALNLPAGIVEEIARAASMEGRLGDLMRGVLYDNMVKGASRIFREMLLL